MPLNVTVAGSPAKTGLVGSFLFVAVISMNRAAIMRYVLVVLPFASVATKPMMLSRFSSGSVYVPSSFAETSRPLHVTIKLSAPLAWAVMS